MHSGAMPLVLPNNCTWNKDTCELKINKDVERKTLDVQRDALKQLRQITGNVCVVSIAGPCRQGKSYILSKVFEQGKVFPLGHDMNPETMGLWLWIVPQRFQDENGREFTVVLFDSEGIDAVTGKQRNDHSVFTLSVLLSSIMIYNCVGRPGRSDLEGLDFIVNLSKRIQLHAKADEQDVKHFHESFPFFIWLLRDVLLELPEGCSNVKEYFIREVFNVKKETHTDQSQKAVECLLDFFSGFDAFFLPPPSVDPKVVKNLYDDTFKSQVNPEFLRLIEEFKTVINKRLSPKKSINIGEFVTGEALATLTEKFVEALNTPGTVPIIQTAWEAHVHIKCNEVLESVLEEYENEMRVQMEKKLPCDADFIRAVHDTAMKECFNRFSMETFSLSIESIKKYLDQLEEKTTHILLYWIGENKIETVKFCNILIKDLKKSILDPLIVRLQSRTERSKMQFADLISAYEKMEKEYKSKARGAKEEQAAVFMDLHPELNKEMKDNLKLLQEFKDFDEVLAKQKDEKAALNKRISLIEENNARLEEERKGREREIELLKKKHEEEMKRTQEMTEKSIRDQQEQMNNMMQANLDNLKQAREEELARQGTLEMQLDKMTSDMKKMQIEQEKREQESREMIEARQKEINQLKEEGFERMIQMQRENQEEMSQLQKTHHHQMTQQQRELYERINQQQIEIQKLKNGSGPCIIS